MQIREIKYFYTFECISNRFKYICKETSLIAFTTKFSKTE